MIKVTESAGTALFAETVPPKPIESRARCSATDRAGGASTLCTIIIIPTRPPAAGSRPKLGTVQPASFRTSLNDCANAHDSSEFIGHPISIAPLWGLSLKSLTSSWRCSAVRLRGLIRSRSSSKSFSAWAALICCLAISDLASAAAVSRPATRASAFAARSCCLLNSVFAAVRPSSNWRSCAAWRLLRIFPAISAAEPATKVTPTATIPTISNNSFHDSSDIEDHLEASGPSFDIAFVVAPRNRMIPSR